LIEFKNVSKVYPNGAVALKNVNINIEKGEFVFIVGSSGAGKSTFLKLIMCEEKPESGDIIFNGRNLSKIRKREIPYIRRNMGTVFQDFRLIDHMTVYDNVAFAMHVVGASNREIKKRVPYICGLVGLEKKMKCKPHELSGGEQQRVGLARALVNNPKIIIADEPTGNVDPDLSFEIVDLLSEINRRGTTVLMVTHEHDLVQHFHKRVIEIHGGVVVADTNVKNQPQPYVRGASVPNTPEQEQDTFQDDDLLDDDYREDDAGEQVTYPDSDYQEMLRRYSVASEEELEEQTEEVKEYIPGHVKEHIVNVETISQPEAQSEDEDNEEEIVHYEDALEELENVLKHETEEDEKDKEVAKG
jgi:hypothetical protein